MIQASKKETSAAFSKMCELVETQMAAKKKSRAKPKAMVQEGLQEPKDAPKIEELKISDLTIKKAKTKPRKFRKVSEITKRQDTETKLTTNPLLKPLFDNETIKLYGGKIVPTARFAKLAKLRGFVGNYRDSKIKMIVNCGISEEQLTCILEFNVSLINSIKQQALEAFPTKTESPQILSNPINGTTENKLVGNPKSDISENGIHNGQSTEVAKETKVEK